MRTIRLILVVVMIASGAVSFGGCRWWQPPAPPTPPGLPPLPPPPPIPVPGK